MAEERVDIVVSERGSRVVRRRLGDVGRESRQAGDSVQFLKRALATLGVAATVRELGRLVNSYQGINNLLRVTSDSQASVNAQFNALTGIANRTRAPLEAVAQLYQRGSISADELGASQEELLRFTENVGLALAQQAGGTGQARGALLQLSQAIGGTIVRAEEFNSIQEGALPILQAAARGIDEAGGSVARLRTLVLEGKIASDEFFRAILSQTDSLEEGFAKTVPTISQSFTVLGNALTVFVGEMDKASGISAVLSGGILGLAENLDVVAKASFAAASGLLLVGGTAAAISGATAAVKALTAAIAANPVGFLLVVLTSAITALTLFRDEITLGIDETTTLGDVMRALGETIGGAFSRISDAASETFGPLIALVQEFGAEVDLSAAGIIRGAAKVVDSYVGLWFGAIQAILDNFQQIPDALKDLFIQGINAALGTFSSFELDNEAAGSAAALGRDLAGSFAAGFTSVTTAQDFIDELFGRAQEIGAERSATEAAEGAQGGGGGGGAGGAPSTAGIEEELDKLIGKYNSVAQAQEEVAAAQDVLNRALEAGVITEERSAEILGVITGQLRDQLDPLGAVNRELTQQRELLDLTNREAEVETQLRQIRQDLLGEGITLNEQELQQMRERLRLIQSETELSQTRNRILEATTGRQREFRTELQAINDLLAGNDISREQANQFLVESNQTLLEGTREAQEALVTQYQDTYARIDELREADLISEQSAAQAKAKADAEFLEQRTQNASDFFGTLASLSQSGNKKIAAIGKAAAITQATIDGVVAVQKALASAQPPVNYALAAAVGAATAANVAQIASESPGFAFGGDFTVGGAGPTDSQMVAFRATPGERVSVSTPEQDRDRERQAGGAGGGGGERGTQIVNVMDPNLLTDYLDSPDSDRVIVNKIQRNAGAIREAINSG